MLNLIFFKSERFPATQQEMARQHEMRFEASVFAQNLSTFLVAELDRRGYVAGPEHVDVKLLYGENCHYLTIENDDRHPFDFPLGFFLGNWEDGHLLEIYPVRELSFRRARRDAAQAGRQRLQNTLVSILAAAEGIEDLSIVERSGERRAVTDDDAELG